MLNFLRKNKIDRFKYFNNVYEKNLFHGDESLSGEGSSLEATAVLQREIPKLIKNFEIKSILDAPCGDLNWMKEVLDSSFDYTGADISKSVIMNNKKRFPQYKFLHLDAVEEIPKSYDLILCRDLLVHLPLDEAMKVIQNFSNSGSKYLLTTTFFDRKRNEDFEYTPKIVQWRPLNLALPPFEFALPLSLIVEECKEGGGSFADKALALYDLSVLRSI
jgi:SAM-dependent methyltransferase